MGFKVHITNTKEEYDCLPTEHLLQGMMRLSRKGIPVGCRGGGCGVCKVEILDGEYETKKMSRAYVTAEEEAQGIVLACRVFPRSDLTLEVTGKCQRQFEKKFDQSAFPSRNLSASSVTTSAE